MTQLDLNLVRYLLVVNEYRTTHAIVRHLEISRSTLNRGLAQLRAHFGNELFITSNGRYEPTAFTSNLIQLISPLLQNLDDYIKHSSESSIENIEGSLSVYAPLYITEHIMFDLMAGLKQHHCKFDLKFHVWPTGNLPDLNQNDFAIGINYFPFDIDRRFIQRRLGSVQLGVYLRADNPLSINQEIDIKELQEINSVRLDPGCNVPFLERVMLEEYGIELKSDITVPSIQAALRCAEQLNYSVFSTNAYPEHLSHNLIWRPVINEGKPVNFEYGFICNRSWYQHPAMKTLEDLLKTSFQHAIKTILEP
ncbi:DNA-binding transcriptional regulator, LysR family [Ferrimonas sediminum]|uniref:DNA-binding transcriptional regulator, LysR family n=1 Tax=Ferrimonas sediminum TaxID=718193 RepID=A0A1G8NK33_9GAMM|nr:LysR family transcriptional regulator [Ferrimonas sediminum]SDI80563.1 DNA-binding transcriptional regulator, LysR family [Ferrimonas sediminum]